MLEFDLDHVGVAIESLKLLVSSRELLAANDTIVVAVVPSRDGGPGIATLRIPQAQ